MQSGLMLASQHALRMVQPKTRRELGGPFFSDYFESVSTIHTWNDSDSILTNYVGHPVMGAVAAYIQIFNDPRGRCLQFERSSGGYWRSRLKAMAWAAVYSAQYEIGPVVVRGSEAFGHRWVQQRFSITYRCSAIDQQRQHQAQNFGRQKFNGGFRSRRTYRS